MEEKEPIKITLGMLIIIIALFASVIIAVFTVLSNNSKTRGNHSIIVEDDDPTSENKVIEDFSTEFLRFENKTENMIYSPLSIKYALNMLNEGANGKTKTQITNALGESKLTTYTNIDKILSLANSVFIRDTYQEYTKPEFTNILKEKYNAELQYDSFKNAKNINKWINDTTFGIISKMVPSSVVSDENTKMILVNALAIDMEWEEQFEDKNTGGKEFTLNDGTTMNASTMSLRTSSKDVSYYTDKNITAISMDLKQYQSTQLEFIGIMPTESLDEYALTFTAEELEKISNKLVPATKTANGIQLSIPKFSFESRLKLKDDLIEFGIKDAFDEEKADFSNMTNDEKGLFLSDAIHKAKIDFTEKGVKAAGATALIMQDTAAIVEEAEPIQINFDKPFLFAIRDKETGEIWFIGTVYEPNSWEKDQTNYKVY